MHSSCWAGHAIHRGYLCMYGSKGAAYLHHKKGFSVPIRRRCGALAPIKNLKMFFNYAIDREWCEENPCAKFKGLYEEKPYQDSLTKTERNRVYDNAVVRDERSGRLLKSHYEQNELNPVSCCLIAFQLFTGRRTRSEASLLKWSMIRRASKKIILERTKTSKKIKTAPNFMKN